MHSEVLSVVTSHIERNFMQDKDGYYYSLDKRKSNEVRRKDLSTIGSSFGKGYSVKGKASGDNILMNETQEPIRKSKRVPKRRSLDVGFDGEDDEDEELRYLEKLSASKVAARYEDGVAGIGREQGVDMDKNYMEEEEPSSEEEPASKIKKLDKVHIPLVEGRNESIPTTRNRALQSGKDMSPGSGASFIEFPNGLPPAPSKSELSTHSAYFSSRFLVSLLSVII